MEPSLRRMCSLAAVVALGVAAIAQPASAAITRVTLTSTDNRNVRCPGTVHVTGTAHGTPGQPLTVTYTTAFNGKPPADILGTPVTATMPASGVAKATYAVPVPVLTGPNDYIAVTAVEPGGPVKQASIKVSCFSLAAPHDVHEITSRKGCGTVPPPIAGPLICDGLIRSGGIMLAWNDDATTLNGYKVYRVDGGQHTLVATVSNGAAARFVGLSKSQGPFAGRCYVVEAYSGTLESRPSDRFCATSDSTATVKTLTPNQSSSLTTRSVSLQNYNNACGLNIDPNQILTGLKTLFGTTFTSYFSWLSGATAGGNWTVNRQSSVLEVGALGAAFEIHSSTQAFSFLDCGKLGSYNTTNNNADAYSLSGVAFPLGPLSGHRVYSATLMMGVGPSVVIRSGKFTRTSGYSCVTEADAAAGQWWTVANLNAWGYHSQKASFAYGPATSIKTDVTSIVQTWANDHDAGDDGFILRVAGDNPALKPVTPSACMTQYKAPRLEVVYF